MREIMRAGLGVALSAGILIGCGNDPKEITTSQIQADAEFQAGTTRSLVNDQIGIYAEQLGSACVQSLLAASDLDYQEARNYNGNSDFTKESGAVIISEDCDTARPEDLDDLFEDFSTSVGIDVVSVVPDEMLLDLKIDNAEFDILSAANFDDLLARYQNDSDYRVVDDLPN